jgi:Ca2+-binding RTX toxin-like protein
VLKGGADPDVLSGGDGADVLQGGGGLDAATYDRSPTRVVVDLADGTARGGDAKGDELSSIENLIGSDYQDALTGDDGPNRLDGGADADALRGRAGDDAVLWDPADAEVLGDAGLDTLLVQSSPFDVLTFGGDVRGFEVVDMSGGGASATVLSASDVLDISDTDELTVLGDADDSLDAGSGWTDGGLDAEGLQVYTQNVGDVMATLLVHPDVQTNLDIVA